MARQSPEQQIDLLERRVNRIERYLRLPSMPDQPIPYREHWEEQEEDRLAALRAAKAGEPPAQAAPIAVAPIAEQPPALAAPMPADATTIERLIAIESARHEAPQGEVAPPPVVGEPLLDERGAYIGPPDGPFAPQPVPPPPTSLFPVAPYQPAPMPVRKVTKQSGLEQTIGLKWAGWVGAIVLAIGVIFGLRFAYEQGWLPTVSISMRLAMVAIGGLALIAAGEFVYRKVSTISAVGLFGAGIATLFIVSYAGQSFGLYGTQATFGLMTLATLFGAGVAMRGRFVSIATLALIGGNLAPVLLHTEKPHIGSFLAYVLMLEAAALFLAWWGNSAKWWALRILSLTTTTLWMAALFLSHPSAIRSATATLPFLLISAALFQLELIVSALRRPSERDGGEWEQGGESIFSVVVTGLLVALLYCLFIDSTPSVRGFWALGVAAACSVMGLSLSFFGHRQSRALATTLRLQSVALVVAAVPIFFQGQAVLVGWAVLALAFAAIGALRGLSVARWAATGTWCLAIAYLALWTGRQFETTVTLDSHDTLFTFMGTAVSVWGAYAGGLALVAQIIAALQQSRPGNDAADAKQWARVTAALGTATWITASVLALPTLPATVSLLAYAWFAAAGDLAMPALWLAAHATAVLLMAMAKWTILDQLSDVPPPASRFELVFNPLMGVGVAVAASMAGIGYFRRRSLLSFLDAWSGSKTDERSTMLRLAGTIIVMMTVGLSFQFHRAVDAGVIGQRWPAWQLEMLSWTMLWSAAYCAYLALIWTVEKSANARARWLNSLSPLATMLALKYLAFDAILFAAIGRTAQVSVGANLQTAAAAVVVGTLVLVRYFSTRLDVAPLVRRGRVTDAMLVLIPLVVGSIEISRACDVYSSSFTNSDLARQVGFSIFWSFYAIVSVTIGFRVRSQIMRYFGLSLFGVTLLKVVLLDMHNVGSGPRILSFLGLGALLLGTSVVYGKLSPKQSG